MYELTTWRHNQFHSNPQLENKLNEDLEGICVGQNSSNDRWIKTLGFPKWSRHNCEYAFMSTFLTNCSVVRTNGVEERHEFDSETRQIHDESK